MKIASIGCSLGAELYSLLYLVRSSDREIRLEPSGVDTSDAILARAKDARFLHQSLEIAGVHDHEIGQMFVDDGDCLEVRDWIRRGIRWLTEDARNPRLVESLGVQDLVLANNFLGPMADADAEQCVGNLLRVVRPGGYLVIDGIDLDVKTRLAQRKGLKAICTRIDEIHGADFSKRGWPWVRWALEPIDRELNDWQNRYSAVFQVPDAAAGALEIPASRASP